jgi:hypothetical protein
MIADICVLTVTTVEGRLNNRMMTDSPKQLLENGLPFRSAFGQIVDPEPCFCLLAFSFQIRIKAVVGSRGAGPTFSVFHQLILSVSLAVNPSAVR